MQQCLLKRRLSFLRKYSDPKLCWSNLASVHYERATFNLLNENEVDLVPKDIPQSRPTERYWARVKSKLRTNGKSARNIKDYQEKWDKQLRPSRKVRSKTYRRTYGRSCEKSGLKFKIKYLFLWYNFFPNNYVSICPFK